MIEQIKKILSSNETYAGTCEEWDIASLLQIVIEVLKEKKGGIGGEVPKEKVERYGIIKGTEVEKDVYNIEKLVEKPLAHQAPSNLAIMGRYVLTPDIFDKIDETEPGVGGEIQLTDALSKLDAIYGVTFEGKTYDIGNRLEWLKTSIEFALDDAEFRDDLVKYMKSYI